MLLAEHIHGSSVELTGKQQQELTDSKCEVTAVPPRSQGTDSEQRLLSAPSAALVAAAGDASASNRNVASACSIESAIDSVICQARAEVATVTELPYELSSELLEAMNAIKDTVCRHLIFASCRHTVVYFSPINLFILQLFVSTGSTSSF